MSDLVSRQDLASFIGDLKLARGWISSFGSQCERTRFSHYEKILSEVLSHRNAGTLELLPDKISVQQYQDAYIQSAELIDIWKVFHANRNEKFAAKLIESVQGPNNPRDEKPGKNSRDTLFELSMAAVLQSCGIFVVIGCQTDLIATFRNSVLLCECKRPRSRNGLGRAAKDASKQLKTAAQEYPHANKPSQIVAIDISLVLNPKYRYLQASNAHSIAQSLDDEMAKFYREHSSAIGQKLGHEVICILTSFRTLAHDRSENRHLSCHKIGVMIYQVEGTSGHRLANSLFEALFPS